MGPVDYHYILCRMDRVLATSALGRMAVGAPRQANHLHPPPPLSKHFGACD